MRRHALGALVALAVGIGLIDPYACVQYSSGSSLRREVPAPERARVLVVVRRVLALLPEPKGYKLDRESVTSESDRTADWSRDRGVWMEAVAARAERAFDPPDPDEAGAPPEIEERVFANSEVALPSGLASETGTLRLLHVDGAVAVQALTAGLEAPTAGRVALPATPAQVASALTIVRVVLADSRTERAFVQGAASRRVVAPPPRAPARAGAVRSLVIELYGARRDVEALVRRLPVISLRRFLDR